MHESGFINSALLKMWSDEVLVADVEDTRTKIGYDGDVHLLLSRSSHHSSDGFLDICTMHGIVFHLLPTHFSDRTQGLDLGTFGLQRSEGSRYCML
jgi:hypothetical protein